MLAVGGLAEDRPVAREELLAGRVEMVAVEVSDKGGVEVADEFLGRKRQRHERVAERRLRVLDERPHTSVVECGVNE